MLGGLGSGTRNHPVLSPVKVPRKVHDMLRKPRLDDVRNTGCLRIFLVKDFAEKSSLRFYIFSVFNLSPRFMKEYKIDKRLN
jgi:hypothetical protein